MKRSTIIRLIVSGALASAGSAVLTGCGNATDPSQTASDGVAELEEDPSSPPITNNTYHVTHGYWHAPYHAWYPYPYNHYSAALGYYSGGRWYSEPQPTPLGPTRPLIQKSPYANRAVGTHTTAQTSTHGTSGKSAGAHIARGGFGGHSFSGAS